MLATSFFFFFKKKKWHRILRLKGPVKNLSKVEGKHEGC